MITRALDASTWPAFADLVERHNGVWGGCWCMGFHPEGVGRHKTPERNRGEKEARVRSGDAHAALVFEDERCVGWCQFGVAGRAAADQVQARVPGRGSRRRPTGGSRASSSTRPIAARASPPRRSGCALELIAGLGGGRVESSPEEIGDRGKVSGSFLHNASLELFQRHGFEPVRKLGKHHWLVSRTVAPSG